MCFCLSFFPYSFCPFQVLHPPKRLRYDFVGSKNIHVTKNWGISPQKYHYINYIVFFMENYGNPLDVGIFPKLFRAARPRKVYKVYMVLSACINDWCPCWALMPRTPWPSYRGAMQDAVRRWWRWRLKRSLLQQAIMGNSPNTGRLFFLTITFGFTALKHRCGDGSKPWYLVNPKIAGKWMFIPLKMYL